MLTLGRRAGLTLAGVGLAMVAGTGIAIAATGPTGPTGPIGISPTQDVVAVAPLAVSVTFGQRLREVGATMQVIGPTGHDVGLGAVTTGQRTLRRHLRRGAPGGDYTIKWTAVSATGRRMAGSFAFTAARSNSRSTSAAFRPSLTAAPTAVPTAVPTAAATAAPNAAPTTALTAVPTAAPEAGATSAPTLTEKPFPETNFTFGAVAGARPPHGHDRNRFTIVPLAVGAFLVLAAGLVARFNRRPRLPA